MWPISTPTESKYVTRRLLFDASSIVSLKAKAASSLFLQNPTRVQVVSGLIWKCAMAAASKARHGSQRQYIFTLAVNIQTKCSPHLPKFSVGNLIWSAIAQCKPHDAETELHSTVGYLQDALTCINSDFVKGIQSDEGFLKVIEHLKKLTGVFSIEGAGADFYACSSLCNAGLYETDFGWGKPTWVSLGAAIDSLSMNLTFLVEIRFGDGIEAWVKLGEQDMAELERDPELLAFASLDTIPLVLGKPRM